MLDLLGIAQGFLLGLVLVFISKKERPTLLLGLFLLTYTAEIIPNLVVDLGYTEQYPFLHWLPLSFYFLSMPLLYLYAKRLTGQLHWKKDGVHLLAGAVEFFTLGAFFLLEAGGKSRLFSPSFTNVFHQIYFGVSMLFVFGYGLMTLLLLRRHQARVLSYYSNAVGKQLHWLKVVVVVLLLFVSLIVSLSFLPISLPGQSTYILVTTINVIIIYYIAVSGIRQSSAGVPVIETSQVQAVKQQQSLKGTVVSNQPSPVQLTDRKNESYQKLLVHFASAKPYLDPQLNMTQLARQLGMSERSLSRLINTESGQHFNGFINSYRVEATKQLLKDPNFDHYTMEGIAFEAGFFSKATFYAAFKRETGMNPTAFKKKP